MLVALSTLVTIGLTILPLVLGFAKLVPKLVAFARTLFGASRGVVGASGFFGVVMTLFFWAGGIGALVFVVMNFDLEMYLKVLNTVVAPFGAVLKGLVALMVSALPSSMPSHFSGLLGIFNYGAIMSVLVLSFSIEFYLRLVMLYLVRRGR